MQPLSISDSSMFNVSLLCYSVRMTDQYYLNTGCVEKCYRIIKFVY